MNSSKMVPRMKMLEQRLGVHQSSDTLFLLRLRTVEALIFGSSDREGQLLNRIDMLEREVMLLEDALTAMGATSNLPVIPNIEGLELRLFDHVKSDRPLVVRLHEIQTAI